MVIEGAAIIQREEQLRRNEEIHYGIDAMISKVVTWNDEKEWGLIKRHIGDRERDVRPLWTDRCFFMGTGDLVEDVGVPKCCPNAIIRYDIETGMDVIFVPAYDEKGPRAVQVAQWNEDEQRWQYVTWWYDCKTCNT